MYAPRRGAAALIATVAASAALATAAPAYASGGADDHGRHGGGSTVHRASVACGTGVLRLKAKADDGMIEVETELDTNRNGQRWAVRLMDNGVTSFRVHRTTHAPSGSFSIEKRIANKAGRDHIQVRVARGATVCTAAVAV